MTWRVRSRSCHQVAGLLVPGSLGVKSCNPRQLCTHEHVSMYIRYILHVCIATMKYCTFDPFRSESLDGGRSCKCKFRLLNTKFGARGASRRHSPRAPNFVFSRRNLHLHERPPSSDSLLNGSKVQYDNRLLSLSIGYMFMVEPLCLPVFQASPNPCFPVLAAARKSAAESSSAECSTEFQYW
eukprot:COSAG02_NODE_801_length_17030_cov_150.308428_6_plen_183_part_00